MRNNDLKQILSLVNEVLEKDEENQLNRQRWKWAVLELKETIESMIDQ